MGVFADLITMVRIEELRLYWVMRALNPMSISLQRQERTQGRRPSEDAVRDWKDESMSQGKPRTAGSRRSQGRGARREVSPSEPPKRNQSCRHLDLQTPGLQKCAKINFCCHNAPSLC